MFCAVMCFCCSSNICYQKNIDFSVTSIKTNALKFAPCQNLLNGSWPSLGGLWLLKHTSNSKAVCWFSVLHITVASSCRLLVVQESHLDIDPIVSYLKKTFR